MCYASWRLSSSKALAPMTLSSLRWSGRLAPCSLLKRGLASTLLFALSASSPRRASLRKPVSLKSLSAERDTRMYGRNGWTRTPPLKLLHSLPLFKWPARWKWWVCLWLRALLLCWWDQQPLERQQQLAVSPDGSRIQWTLLNTS